MVQKRVRCAMKPMKRPTAIDIHKAGCSAPGPDSLNAMNDGLKITNRSRAINIAGIIHPAIAYVRVALPRLNPVFKK